MTSSRRIHLISLGCPKNRVDSEVMLGVSDRAGYRHVDLDGSGDAGSDRFAADLHLQGWTIGGGVRF